MCEVGGCRSHGWLAVHYQIKAPPHPQVVEECLEVALSDQLGVEEEFAEEVMMMVVMIMVIVVMMVMTMMVLMLVMIMVVVMTLMVLVLMMMVLELVPLSKMTLKIVFEKRDVDFS